MRETRNGKARVNLLLETVAVHLRRTNIAKSIMGSGGEEKSKKSARKAQLKEEAERLGITCEIDIPRPLHPCPFIASPKHSTELRRGTQGAEEGEEREEEAQA